MQEICRKYGVLIIADEVLCGAGRVGTFFASSQFGLQPDILTLGKGLSGGYAPLSAVMVREEHAEAIYRGSGSLVHLQTYQNVPSICAAGVAVLDFYERENLLEHARKVGNVMREALSDALAGLPAVGHVSGTGLLMGIELVADKPKKLPFARAIKASESVVARALEEGLVLYAYSGQVGKGDGDQIILAPPLITSESQALEIVSTVERVVSEAPWIC